MDRIDFEDANYGLNLRRNGEGYASKKTQERFEAWRDAFLVFESNRRWRVRKMVRKAMMVLLVISAATGIIGEVVVMSHFVAKYW